MKVQIEGNLYLESDSYQFVLREYTGRVDKKDKPIYKSLGYFSSLPAVINKLVKMRLNDSTATDLKSLHREVSELSEYISLLSVKHRNLTPNLSEIVDSN